jgi:hypothetical protein
MPKLRMALALCRPASSAASAFAGRARTMKEKPESLLTDAHMEMLI